MPHVNGPFLYYSGTLIIRTNIMSLSLALHIRNYHIEEGDVCLLQSLSSCRGAGLVTFVRDARQLGVCMESFGFIEAYVVCRKLGLARIQTLSHAP